jgi:hypothetical protein
MKRLDYLFHFYEILEKLEFNLGGKRILATCMGQMDWPQWGVYFFFEPRETRNQSGVGQRVVRVGTHALTNNSRTTLWNRLSQHKGTISNGGGNHRGSIFRKHVGAALLNRDTWSEVIRETWGKGSSATAEVRQAELPLERAVSQYIRQMPFLWLAVEDAPSPQSLRGVIERNSIALLTNFNVPAEPLDSPNPAWLGHWADSNPIHLSGLWNVNHVTEIYNPMFLEYLENLVLKQFSRNN